MLRAHAASPTRSAAWIACLTLVCALAVFQSGCGIASNLMHGLGMDMIPAEYEGLEESKVAIVTLTDSSQYSNDVAAQDLSGRIGGILTLKVKDVKLVRDDQIAKWRDLNGWDAIDFQDIGEGVEADKVLGIELTNLKLREGQTLYRGKSDVIIKVIDVASGTIDYQRSIDEFTYPTLAGQDVAGISESKFRRRYLTMLAREIARSFHPYDMTDRFAMDSEGITQF